MIWVRRTIPHSNTRYHYYLGETRDESLNTLIGLMSDYGCALRTSDTFAECLNVRSTEDLLGARAQWGKMRGSGEAKPRVKLWPRCSLAEPIGAAA